MRAGSLRHRITIQQATTTQDAYGEPVPTWATYATRWAAIVPVSGSEADVDGMETAEVRHKFRIRHTSGVRPKMRISYDSRVFEILAVIDVGERGKQMELICQEIIE